MAGSEPRVKGVAFNTIDACFVELRGVPARDRARELMPESIRDAYHKHLLLAASWYPISWYRQVFRAFRLATGEGLELPRSIGYLAVRKDMASTYKQILARLVSPQMLLGISGWLFNTFYDTGRFEVLESRKGYVRVLMSECIGWDANMWSEMKGSSVAFLELAGARNVVLAAADGAREGDTHAEMEAQWGDLGPSQGEEETG